MSRISLASRLAISFIRPFRSYLDGYILIKESKSKIQEDLKERLDTVAHGIKNINPDLDENKINYAKNYLLTMNLNLLENYDKSYENVLPEVIDELTVSLEKEILNSFSEKEIEKLTDIINDPLVKKLLSNKQIFRLLKNCEIDMNYKLGLETIESTISSNNLEKIRSIFEDFNKNTG